MADPDLRTRIKEMLVTNLMLQTTADQIGDELADEMPAIMDGKLPLLLDGVTPRDEFDDQSVFVKLLIKTGLQLIEYRHSGTENLVGKFFVKHGAHLTADGADGADKVPADPRLSALSAVLSHGKFRVKHGGFFPSFPKVRWCGPHGRRRAIALGTRKKRERNS
jgi:hypothetical protein